MALFLPSETPRTLAGAMSSAAAALQKTPSLGKKMKQQMLEELLLLGTSTVSWKALAK